ncbi:MAG: HAMP domain-containing sensor histidine kinase [Patescibacteria group bacterium]
MTSYYTLGVLVILTIFNIMVYSMFVSNIRAENTENKEHLALENKDDGERSGNIGETKIQEIQDDLANNLLTSDIIILLITLFVSYFISRRTLLPLEESYKNQKRFVADVAHELRTPLAVLQAGGETMLRSDRTVPEYAKFIQESLDEIKRLSTLSNDLLFLVRNNVKKESQINDVSFGNMCQSQIDIMRPYASTKDISIESTIDKSIVIKGKSDDLVRMYVNILKNAIDYNKKGGTVSVVLEKKYNKAILKISDTGIGIKKEDLPHIFERFFKADNSRTQNASGTGLGLAIVKKIVHEHLGSIKVDSEESKGSTFEIILPCI